MTLMRLSSTPTRRPRHGVQKVCTCVARIGAQVDALLVHIAEHSGTGPTAAVMAANNDFMARLQQAVQVHKSKQ